MKLPKHIFSFYIPLLVLVTLDFYTTYIGVCFFNGYELNSQAIGFVVQIGFLPVAFLYLIAYFIGCFGLAFAYNKKKSLFSKVFILVVWSMVVLNYAQPLMLNIPSLINYMLGKQVLPMYSSVSPENLKQAQVSFEEYRTGFCRLI